MKELTNNKRVFSQEKEWMLDQFKVLDITSPLLEVFTRLNRTKGDPIVDLALPAIKATLLNGRARSAISLRSEDITF